MVERRRFGQILPHLILWTGVVVLAFPVYVAFIASTQDAAALANGQWGLWPGDHAFENYRRLLWEGAGSKAPTPVARMLFNSLVSALAIACGKIAISFLSAFAIVYFRFPFRLAAFWLIFLTLMLPVEVRIYPTYKIVANLHMLDSYAGLTIPLLASATATLLFRQFFLTLPNELLEAAKLDGAKPLQFLRDILLPLSRANLAALFVILFIYGWNQYLWPLLVTTHDDMLTMIVGVKKIAPTGDSQADWPLAMAAAVLAMAPPVLAVVVLQKYFVKGLMETES